jgi:hypothetical protein
VPRGLRILEGVRALADDVSGTVAEALANVTESCLATLVLSRIRAAVGRRSRERLIPTPSTSPFAGCTKLGDAGYSSAGS